MKLTAQQLKQKTRMWILFFVISLAISGITAIPVEQETHWLRDFLVTYWPDSTLTIWISQVYHALADMAKYPFLAYGYDWLAFAHIIIGIAFIGPLMDPVRNKWVILFGMIACILIVPLALIAGHFRQIPFWWQLCDCSFGIIGLIPLYITWKNIRQLEIIEGCIMAQLH